MARSEIPFVVQAVDPSTGRTTAVNGASVQVNARNADGTSGSAATVYSTPDTGSTVSNPLATGNTGRVDGWLEPGRYNLVISGSGITTYTQPYDVAGDSYATVVSAGTITIPVGATVVSVTGTTNITSVTAASIDAGRRVTLIFAGILTFTDGSNLKIAGNLVTTADDTITIVCDGTSWFEAARAVN